MKHSVKIMNSDRGFGLSDKMFCDVETSKKQFSSSIESNKWLLIKSTYTLRVDIWGEILTIQNFEAVILILILHMVPSNLTGNFDARAFV